MDYLNLISNVDGTATDEASETAETPAAPPPCSECGRRLSLPESRAIGRCVRCQSEAEFVDTLARIKMHHERTKRAVAARVKELGGTR